MVREEVYKQQVSQNSEPERLFGTTASFFC